MRGRYFVLGKLLSPLEGVGPDELPIANASRRVTQDGVTRGDRRDAAERRRRGDRVPPEARARARSAWRVSRIASGVPHGGDLEFADPITMGRALSRSAAPLNDEGDER